MANKLTKEKLDLLIEQVLSEIQAPENLEDFDVDLSGENFNNKSYVNDTLKPTPAAWSIKGDIDDKGRYKNALNTIKNLDNNPNNISYKDVVAGLKNDNDDVKNVSQNLKAGKKFKINFYWANINNIIKYNLKRTDIYKNLVSIATAAEQNENSLNAGYSTKQAIALNLDNKYSVEKLFDTLKRYEPPKDISYTEDLNKNHYRNIIKMLIRRNDPIKSFFLSKPNPSLADFFKEHNKNIIQSLPENFDDMDDPQKTLFHQYVKNPFKHPDLKQKTDEISNQESYKLYDLDKRKEAASVSPEGLPPEDKFPTRNQIKRTSGEPLGALELSYTGLAPKGKGFGDLKSGTKQFDLTIDPSLEANISAIDGNNMLEKISNIADFANNLNSRLSDEANFGEVAAYCRVLNFLADAAREYEDASAGTVFETFLAAMGKGIVIGGESGATDIATISGGKPVYYSAKLYSSNQIGQSDQANIGFKAVAQEATKEEGPGLIYVIGIKTDLPKAKFKQTDNISFSSGTSGAKIGKSGDPAAIAMCVLRIKYAENKYTVTAIGEGGKEYSIESKISSATGDEETTLDEAKNKVTLQSIVTEVANNDYWFGYIPIFVDAANAAASTAKNSASWLSEKIGSFGSAPLQALKGAFGNLREMDLLSQEHTAKGKNLTAGGHITYINSINKQYTDFSKNYKTVIGAFNLSDTDKAGIQGPIKENKNKSLKELDKLIERVILNKMNKL